jgi:hypothetical protein
MGNQEPTHHGPSWSYRLRQIRVFHPGRAAPHTLKTRRITSVWIANSPWSLQPPTPPWFTPPHWH